jgi:hypothetical protein
MTAGPRVSRGKPPRGGQYRRASEVRTFLFCQSAWMFERQGAPSEREPERASGTVYHHQHGARVEASERTASAAWAFLLIAIILIVLALWTGLR